MRSTVIPLDFAAGIALLIGMGAYNSVVRLRQAVKNVWVPIVGLNADPFFETLARRKPFTQHV